MSRVSRAYPPSEAYDDRPRRRGGRDYQEVDVDVRESDYRRAPPEYLREDYGRPSHAGPMVVRERTEVDYDGYERERSRPPPRSSRGNGEEVDVQIHENDYSRAPPRSRRGGQNREDIEVDYRERSRAPRDYDQETVYVREDDNRRPPPPRTSEREEITIRREEDEAPSPPRSSYHRERSRTRVNVDVRDREVNNEPPYPRSRSRAPPAEDEEIDVKINREPSRSRAGTRDNNRDTLVVRESSRTRRRSMPPPRNVAREREDFVYRRRSPSRPRESEEIVIRQKKTQSPSPSPPAAPTPPPPPPPQVETRPPIVQEVITHHRHIDHGVVHAPQSPEPSPSPPPQRQKQDLEVDIRRTDAQGNTTEEDIRIRDNENYRRDSQRDRGYERRVSRRRSMDSAPAGPVVRRSNKEETNINVNIDADFGNSNPDRRLAPRQKPREMWTEVTKDLVSREAIEAQGFQYEETEDFFYVMAYLRYEDVARLVDITEDMRYGRRERIDQIQWERQDPRLGRDSRPPPRRGPPPSERYDGWDEVTHDREVTYEDRSRRGHR